MTTPIACSLDASAYEQRVNTISRLNAQGWRAQERDGRTLLLTYAAEMMQQVRQLVAKESHCCAFLTFKIEESDGHVRLAIHAPEVSFDEVDAFFALFLTGTPATPGRLCRSALSVSRETPVHLISRLTCPECGLTETLTMPTNACQYFHECSGCHALLRPKSGHCCVFCSFGTVPCPPMQNYLSEDAMRSCGAPALIATEDCGR